MNIEQARFNMIEQQIRPWNVLDADVLHLLAVVQRENFVPPAHRTLAFVDMEIPLGDGQLMLAPRLEARLLQEAAVQKNEKVLEIGTGTGYLTALLARRGQSVISLEINPAQAAIARANLKKAGIQNAEVQVADGATARPAEGPFNVIVLGGSVAKVPPALLAQLRVGGRLVGIVGDDPAMRATLIQRTSETNFVTTQPWDTGAPRLLNFPEHATFIF